MKRLTLSLVAVALVLGIMVVPMLADAAPPAPGDVAAAISNGLAWLADQQNANGSWSDPDMPDPVACTGLVLSKFLDNAYETGKDPFETDPGQADYYQYEPNVAGGFEYLFVNSGVAYYDSINDMLYFSYWYATYDTSIAAMAVASSRAPGRVISGGVCNGITYAEALQAMVNWLVDSQVTDAPWTGGWSYWPEYTGWADQSNAAYATLALGYANAGLYGFNIPIPAATLSNLGTWITTVQATTGPDAGGSIYSPTYNYFGANIYRTGALLYEQALIGETSASPEVQAAVAFVESCWGNNADEYDLGGWIGNYQAVFSLMKGLQSLGIEQITVGGNTINWFDDVANYIVANEQVVDATHCYWSSPYEEPDECPILSTAWALMTLEKAVPQIAPGISVTKVASSATISAPGTVTYTYTVCNMGNVTLNPVTLADDTLGAIALPASLLAPGQCVTATANFNVSQAMIDDGSPIVNTVTATGHPPTGPDVTATATSTVTIEGPVPPIPELPTGLLLGLGVAVLAGFGVVLTLFRSRRQVHVR